MSINFNEKINRLNTGNIKWDNYGEDYIPLWVADMDFKSPDEVLEALEKRIAHGIFGYTKEDKELTNIIMEHFKKQYGYEIDSSWLVWLPSVMPAVNVICRMIEGSIMINTPMYMNIRSAPINADKEIIEVPLKYTQGTYTFDFEAMEKSIKADTKLFILCNPHNPVGRVYTKEELDKLVVFAKKHNLIICSDEIHCELVYEKKHIPMVTLKDEFINSITLMSPGKTYNLPGIPIAFGVIPDKELRNQFLKASAGVLPKPGVLNYEVCKAAYSKGEAWRQDLLKHLKDNIDFIKEEINKRMPVLKVGEVEGSYLAWIDARELGVDDPYKFFLNEAKVVFSDGRDFGESGYLRLNFACSREVLEEALDRMENAINKMFKL